jgi:hypothetical protein
MSGPEKPMGRNVKPVHITNSASDPVPVAPVTGGEGTAIQSPADTVVGIGATVPLPAPPATTTRFTVENTGPGGSAIRVREVGGIAGAGFLLPRFGVKEYGGPGGSVAALEAEDVSLATFGVAVATTVGLQFEKTS